MFLLWNPFWPEPPTKVFASLRAVVHARRSMLARQPGGDYRILEIVPPKVVFVPPERYQDITDELDEESSVENE